MKVSQWGQRGVLGETGAAGSWVAISRRPTVPITDPDT